MKRCTVRDGDQSLTLEADSLYDALMRYETRIVCSYPEATGMRRPDMQSLLEVTVDGSDEVYRRTMQQAWDWANRRSAERNRRARTTRQSAAI